MENQITWEVTWPLNPMYPRLRSLSMGNFQIFRTLVQRGMPAAFVSVDPDSPSMFEPRHTSTVQ